MDIENPQFLEELTLADQRLTLCQSLISAAKAKTMLEVGIWKGQFSKHILTNCPDIEAYFMIDPWAKLPDWNRPGNFNVESFDAMYREAMRNVAFAREKVTVLRGRTSEMVDRIPDNSLDVAYIDGDHTLRGITIDLIKLFPKIKLNGLIVGDDFYPDPWKHDLRYEPILVCPFSIHFAEAMDIPIAALPFHQFVIQKKKGASFKFIDTTGEYGGLTLKDIPSKWGFNQLKHILRSALRRKGYIR